MSFSPGAWRKGGMRRARNKEEADSDVHAVQAGLSDNLRVQPQWLGWHSVPLALLGVNAARLADLAR